MTDRSREERAPADGGRELTDAIRVEARRDPRLARALAPAVEDALAESARRDPGALAQRLAPAIGPAASRWSRAKLAGLVERAGRALERWFSPRSLRWRLEAARTRRSFAEVALQKRLIYRVERVVLVRADSRETIARVAHPAVAARGAGRDAALEGFVETALREPGGRGRDHVEYGERTRELVRGARLALGADVRGEPPDELRGRLATLLRELELDFPALERASTGASTLAADLEPLLERALEAQERPLAPPRTAFALLALALAAAVLLAVWGGATCARRDARLELVASALRNEPGYVVLAAERHGERISVDGLRDPLARKPDEVYADVGLDAAGIEASFAPFASLDARLVARRILGALAPPPGVQAAEVDGRVALAGRAHHAWIALARSVAAALGGADLLDASRLVDVDREALRELAAALNGRVFPAASGPTSAGDGAPFQALRVELERLEARARAAEQEVAVRVVSSGAPSPAELAKAIDRAELPHCKLAFEDVGARLVHVGGVLTMTWGSFGLEVEVPDAPR